MSNYKILAKIDVKEGSNKMEISKRDWKLYREKIAHGSPEQRIYSAAKFGR